ncbi:MAG: hypothetical protein AAFY08_15110 [Planctomycetota bacterium]
MTLDLTIDAAVFLADFGESVTITPGAGTGAAAPYVVEAIVDRDPPQGVPGAPFAGARQPVVLIDVRNHATLGVLPESVVTAGDVDGTNNTADDVWRVTVASREGAAGVERPIQRVHQDTDAGLVRLEVRLGGAP